jgi:hypothetical protein
MIATLAEFKIHMDIAETDDSQDVLLNQYLTAVDGLFNALADYEFDSTTYVNQEYNGTGGPRLWLKHIPVTAITQISTGRIPAIRIKNTSSDAQRATIDIDVSAELLYYAIIGGTNATVRTSIDLTDAGSDTLAELITTINALGKGWSAEIAETSLNSILSTELVEVMGLNCGVPRRGGSAQLQDLEIPDTPLGAEIRIEDPEMGTLNYPGGFPKGINNVIVSFTAGYTSATMPNELKVAVMVGAQALYIRGEEDGFGVTNFSIGALMANSGRNFILVDRNRDICCPSRGSYNIVL